MGLFDWIKGRGRGEASETSEESWEEEQKEYDEAMEAARKAELEAERKSWKDQLEVEKKAKEALESWEREQRELWEGYHPEEAAQQELSAERAERIKLYQLEAQARAREIERAKSDTILAEEMAKVQKRTFEEQERARTRKGWVEADKAKKWATVGRLWGGVKEVAGPRTPIKGWYIPKAMPGYYLPGASVRKYTDPTGAPAGYMHMPNLGGLQRASAPPPTASIKAPFRDVERFEGLGSTLSRMRELEKFPVVDRAVYAEIHANGDIDTPSHVRREVSQLGFSMGDINQALKRLRDMGYITYSGREHAGERELMVVGD